MGARAFVDTTVLVYLYDSSESEADKRTRARRIMLDDDLDLVISAQVLNEFLVTVTRKIPTPLSAEAAATAVGALAELEVVPLTRNLVLDAIVTGSRHQLGHWDALIVEAAARSGCELLLTEDLATGATIAGVTITNPFA